jgi:hypothetical protein
VNTLIYLGVFIHGPLNFYYYLWLSVGGWEGVSRGSC